MWFRAEVASPPNREELVQRVISQFDGIYFLINNAEILYEKEILEIEDEEFLRVMQVNVFSMFSGVQVIPWYRSKVFAWRKNAASLVEAMTFFERGYLTKKFH